MCLCVRGVRVQAEFRRGKAREELSSEKKNVLNLATEEGQERVKVLDKQCVCVCVCEREQTVGAVCYDPHGWPQQIFSNGY